MNEGAREFSRLPWLGHDERRQLGSQPFWSEEAITKGKGVQRIIEFLFPQPTGQARPDPAGGAFDFSYLKEALLQGQRNALWNVEGLTNGAHYQKQDFWRDDKPELDNIVRMTLNHMPEFEDPVDVTALPASAYGLRPAGMESQWAGGVGVPDYYQTKGVSPRTSNARMLYLQQSTIRGVDSNDPLSSVAMVAPQIMTFDRVALGQYLNFVDLKTSAQLGPSPSLDYNIIPRRAWWEMWMQHHVNALHPTTLILFALHQFGEGPDVSLPGTLSLDSRMWAWRTQEASVRVFFQWMWNTGTEERNKISKLLRLFPDRRSTETRVINARAALQNIIHGTPGTLIARMRTFLRGLPLNGENIPIREAFDKTFWDALQAETGWGVNTWPVSIVRDDVHIELFMPSI